MHAMRCAYKPTTLSASLDLFVSLSLSQSQSQCLSPEYRVCVPDRFHPIILTPYGGWWRWGNNSEHNDFLANVAHSGDAAPGYDIEAPRFDHHGRTWASWTHTAFMRQAVACATAVATFGGATYAAKCEMRDLHSAASQHQVGELAEDDEPPESMPEPVCSA